VIRVSTYDKKNSVGCVVNSIMQITHDIVAISVSAGFIVAQRSDGTMIGIGDNEYGECDVSEWTDIVAFATGSHHTVGIQADGDVEFTGMSKFGQGQCTRWTGIKIPD